METSYKRIYLKLNSENKMAQNSLHNQALALFDQGQFNLALPIFNEALLDEPKNPVIWHDRGICYFQLDLKKEALSDLNQAVLLDDQNPYRYACRAFVLAALKETHQAIADYEKAIQLDPEDAIAYNNLGMLQEQLGYAQTAKDNFAMADALSGLLKDSGIDSPSKVSAVQNTKPPSKAGSLAIAREMMAVFISKSQWKAYKQFLKNSFKTRKDGRNKKS
jgi:Flp pilus assembly protein TadD